MKKRGVLTINLKMKKIYVVYLLEIMGQKSKTFLFKAYWYQYHTNCDYFCCQQSPG